MKVKFIALVIALLAPHAVVGQTSDEVQAELSESNEKGARASETASEERLVAGSNKEKVVCRRDKVIGSRMTAKRVCKTARQWEIERMEQRQTVERGQNQRTLSGG
ncbi:MAG: hypothetical protein DI637_03340 [Citromicrobium sp.]|nr:MAG: hypothetical protein DI637_03340 [Citromicrobium sp.]